MTCGRAFGAIRERGLRIEGASGDRTVRGLNVSDSPDAAGICDLVIIATKASGVGDAAESIAHPRSRVCGADDSERAGSRGADRAASAHRQRAARGCRGLRGIRQGTGPCAPQRMELIRLGEMHGGISDRLNGVAALWQQAGFNVKGPFADINQLIWEKFICNVTFSAPCTVFGRTLSEVMNDPHSWKIALVVHWRPMRPGVQSRLPCLSPTPSSTYGISGVRCRTPGRRCCWIIWIGVRQKSTPSTAWFQWSRPRSVPGHPITKS
ncbi:MAG: hypothetical protein CM1200mP20_07340 [Pseudomonadota bacterium]|nr:MAG: hypothetical protein CM1200mP20_07340 [Pseudomonadota bacterium]